MPVPATAARTLQQRQWATEAAAAAGEGGGGGSRSNLGLSSMLLTGPIPTSLAMLREQSGSALLASLDDRNRCGLLPIHARHWPPDPYWVATHAHCLKGT